MEKFTLQLMSPLSWEIIPNTRYVMRKIFTQFIGRLHDGVIWLPLPECFAYVR
jgi:hypothetical protein